MSNGVFLMDKSLLQISEGIFIPCIQITLGIILFLEIIFNKGIIMLIVLENAYHDNAYFAV